MPDHSIIVAGSSLDPATFNSELVLVRLDASGAPNAYAFQDVGGTGEINALALQGSDVIAAGDAFGATTIAVRFDSTSGSFDSTFGNTGVATLDTLSTEGGAQGVAVDSNGNIGLVTTSSDTHNTMVVRLTADGALDSSFSSGVVTTDLVSGQNDLAGISVDAEGNLVVTATAKTTALNQDIALERFLSGNAVVIFNPVATINGAPASATAGTTINLTSTVTPGSSAVQSYAWSVSRNGVAYGSGGTASNFSFTPADAATYVVTLTVTDTDGGASTDTASINVTPAATVSATVINGVLTINGDGAGNSVNVTLDSAGNYRVVIDSQVNQTFAFGTINGIFIQAGNGNDTVSVGAGITVAAEIHGGAGNDFLTGGNGNDLLLGEDGNDLLQGRGGDDVFVGGAGTDILTGGSGRDVLIGGLGSDLIAGDSGDDILIAGSTAHDANPTALNSIRSIWSGSGTYATRVSTLRGNLLSSSNLFNDTSIDLLSGNSGRDWMIANVSGGGTPDLILGTASNETVTDL
jgi:Ca2+-binding RTX toxin-like protein